MAIFRGIGGAGDSTTDATVTEVTQQATNAAASATAAASSASSAATSASNAATSATDAETAKTDAETAQTAAEAAQTEVEAIRDSIESFYLGAEATEPTTDDNGDALTAGDWYFNTTDNQTYIYNGTSFQGVSPDLLGDITPQVGGNLDTNGSDILVADDDSIKIGTGNDLVLSHSSSTNISTLATSSASDVFQIKGGTSAYFQGHLGYAKLFGNTSVKLETTSTGVDVTGTVNADTYTGGNVSNWDTAYGWGDHSTAGYLTQVIDDTSPRLGGSLLTSNNNITFATNDKAQFGPSLALKIYHDGSNSYITDSGIGNLKIVGSQIDLLGGADGAETMATFVDDGAVTLYYDNGAKLATTSTGVDITGTVTTDGFTVNDYSLPSADGTNGQVLTTNGAGTLSFADASTVAALNDLTDVSTTGIADGQTIVYNSSTTSFEPGTAGGNTTTNGLWEHSATISTNYTITSGNNAVAAGPIDIASGVTVTIPSGSRWAIV